MRRPLWPAPAALAAATLVTGCARLVPPELGGPPTLVEKRTAGAHIRTIGGTGMIEMPTARMMNDGEFATSVFTAQPNTGFALSFQATPWAEGVFRYLEQDDFFGRDDDLFDRSFDVKFRILEEGEYWPAIVVGLQDILGTGVQSGEYIVASKRFYDLDLHLGLGFGRLGSAGTFENPLIALSEQARRRRLDVGLGGDFSFETYFRGEDVALFGGITFKTPVDGLVFHVEYSGDEKVQEELRRTFDFATPINVALEYEVVSGLNLQAALINGDTLGLRATLHVNGADPPPLNRAGPAVLPVAVRPPRPPEPGARPPDGPIGVVPPGSGPAGIPRGSALLTPTPLPPTPAPTAGPVAGPSPMPPVAATVASAAPFNPAERAAIAAATFEAVREAGLIPLALELEATRARLYYDNTTFRRELQGMGRAARALTGTLPPAIERFVLVPAIGGPTFVEELEVPRAALEQAAKGAAPDLTRVAELRPAPARWAETALTPPDLFPRYTYSIFPTFRYSLFDPDDPYRYQFYGIASGNFRPIQGLNFQGSLSYPLFGNFDEIVRESDSVLPRVRSDFRRYLQEADLAIEALTVEYRWKPSDEIFARATAGLFETMFGGVAGELLWRPEDSRLAYGVEVAHVRQRDFDQLFQFRDYEVTTGHASVYYDSPLFDFDFAVHAGRYLAGDWGATFEVTRRFDSGVEIGAFATFTDVPFEDFGEGSFDKGLIIVVPLDLILPIETRDSFPVTLRPVTRDGGQRLAVQGRLFRATQAASRGELSRDWTAFFE